MARARCVALLAAMAYGVPIAPIQACGDTGRAIGELMSEFKTRFYNDWTGVQFTVAWRNQEDCLAARRFLENLLGRPASTIQGHDYFVLEDEPQFDALFEFRRKLGYEYR